MINCRPFLASLESFCLLLLTILLIIFAAKDRFRFSRAEAFLLVFMVSGLASNAAIDSNYGTAIRHKLPYIMLLFVFLGRLGVHLIKHYFTARKQTEGM